MAAMSPRSSSAAGRIVTSAPMARLSQPPLAGRRAAPLARGRLTYPRAHAAHGVLGADGARPGAGVRADLGRAAGDLLARAPHREPGAGRRGVPQGGLAGGVGAPRAAAVRAMSHP